MERVQWGEIGGEWEDSVESLDKRKDTHEWSRKLLNWFKVSAD